MWFADISWRQFRRSLGGFSAIVCKQGNDVWAEDPYGKTIAQGEAGVDDASVIQSALNVGGKVFITKGEYKISEQLVLDSNTVVVGEGKATVLRIAGGIRPDHINAIFHAKDKQDIIIEKIYFDGNLRTNGTTNNYFEGAIQMSGVKHVTVRDCVFYDFYSNPIDFAHTENNYPEFIKILNNTILYHNGDAAIQIRAGYRCIISANVIHGGGGIFLRDSTHRGVVAENVIRPEHGGTNIDGGPYGDGGIQLYQAYNNVIYGNVIERCKIGSNNYNGVGISCNVSDLNVIIANEIKNCESSGIQILNSHRNLVIANYLTDNCLNASANYRDELIIYGSTETFENFIIGNRIIEIGGQKCRYGIYIDSYQEGSIVRDNIINYISPAIVDEGVNTVVQRNIGYATENSGTATFSGDGTTTDFEIGAHGLVTSDPSKIAVKITPVSQDAINASPCVGYVDPADNTKIRVKFASAPVSGAENVKIVWHAEVIS